LYEYNYKGEKIQHLPYNIEEEMQPVYKEFKGWKARCSACQLMMNYQKIKEYIEFIEKKSVL
jgi:adenylosuccinate synthase